MMADAERLADELFEFIEFDQGQSYISDGIGVAPDMTTERVIGIARFSAAMHERCARKLREWISRHEKTEA